MPKTEIQFHGTLRIPYISNLISYTCDSKEGVIEFNGYYYIYDENNEEHRRYSDKRLPTIERMTVRVISDAPPEIKEMSDADFTNFLRGRIANWSDDDTSPKDTDKEEQEITITNIRQIKYEYLSVDSYVIEIYKRDIIENTNQYSTIDDGSEELNVCFFPTNKQRLYFRVLAVNPSHDEIKRLMGADYFM